MINLQGLKTSDGFEKLIGVYGNDFHIWDPVLDTWTGQGVNVTYSVNKWRSAVFLDKAYFVNGWTQTSPGTITVNDNTMRYDATTWRDEYVANKLPISKYVHQVGDRIFYSNCYFKGISQLKSSMTWFNDLPDNNNVTYGFEEGTTLNGDKDSTRVYTTAPTVYFITRNIKVGDPIFIVSLNKTFYVSEVQTERSLILTQPLTAAVTNSNFWVGSNWVETSPSDGDETTGLGDNNDNLLIFKRDSLFRYDIKTSLRKIKGVPGTTSQESVVNIKDKTYYFHSTGVWECDGVTSRLISRPIQDYIDAVSSDMYPNIVAWVTGPSQETLRVFVGDLTDTDNNISLTNAILDYDTSNQAWSPGALPFKVTCATTFRESNTNNVLLGTDVGTVYQDNKGTSDNTVAIPWMIDTGFHFPAGPQIEIEFEKFQVHSKKGRGMQVKYKLYGTPYKIDKQWRPLNDVENDVTEFILKGRSELDNKGRGIAIQFTESSDDKTPIIERVDLFWKPTTARSL